MTQFYDERLRPSGLRTTQFQLLMAVSEMGTTAQQPLADFMGMDRTTVTRNLALLERQGLVRVGVGKGDRRARAITLTSEGRAALHHALPLWQEAQASMRERTEAEKDLTTFENSLSLLTKIGLLAER